MTEKTRRPPKFAEWIIGFLIDESTGYTALGDYEEEFHHSYEQNGYIYAAIQYWLILAGLLPVFLFESIRWSFAMIKNHLKITFRTLLKNKTFSVINITGLALSISICLMIIIYIKDWRSSDQFHENKDRIYRVYTTDTNFGWDVDGWATTPPMLAPYLQDNYPFIEDAARLRMMWNNVLHNKTAIPIRGFYAEPSFFTIFSYKLKDGKLATALNKPYSIVLSEETAIKFFGHEDPMFKILTLEELGDFTVTGILEYSEQKSHLNFDALISFSTIPSLENKGIFEEELNNWRAFTRFYTYLLLKNEDDLSLFESQLAEIEKRIILEKDKERFAFAIQHITDINLGKNLGNATRGTKSSIDVFFIPFLAVLLIFLVCFNYIILSIARSLKRSKEIGLRKVVGAKRSQVIKLFLSETFVITFLALISACFFILWLIPVFNGLEVIVSTQQQINLEMMKDPSIYLSFILLAVGVSILAGLYPALYLSSIRPVSALKGVSRIKGLSHLLTRKILMAIQFGVSIVSIIFIVYFYNLYTYWVSYDRGISTGNTVYVSLRDVNYETFRNEIKTQSAIRNISFSSQIPVFGGGDYTNLKTETMEEPLMTFYISIDPEFLNNFGIDIIAGRNFSNEFITDIGEAVLINEKAVEALGFGFPEEAIGSNLTLGSKSQVRIIGVVKNFNRSFENPVDPLVLQYQPKNFRYANIVFAQEKKEDVKAWLPAKWKEFDEVHPAYFGFYDDLEEEFNASVGGSLKISAWACGFVILIALFGLLGMAAYTTELRVKEIGIRKVLGASVRSAVYVLSKDYIKLILYTSILAVPFAYFLSGAMFQFFTVRPGLSLWVLPAALVFILALAILTVGSQTVKAAVANPVDTLRAE